MRALLVAALLVAVAVPAHADPVPDACPERTISSGTDPEHIVTTRADCTVDVELNRGIICVGAWGRTDHHFIGPVHIINHRCTFPGGDPVPPVVLDPPAAGPCGVTHVDGPVSVALKADCTVLVSIRLYECVWGGYWYQHAPPPAEVREYRCGPPPA